MTQRQEEWLLASVAGGHGSFVAVDDADDDDDRHASESEESQDEPAILEPALDDASEEERGVASPSVLRSGLRHRVD